MHSRIAFSTIAFSMLLASFPVFAESVHIRESSSAKVKSDEAGTTTTIEEHRVEERSGNNAGASMRVQSDKSDTVIRSESFRRATCYAIPGGDSRCTEEVRGQRAPSDSARVSVNGKDWWQEWRVRVLRTAQEVASDTAEDRIETTVNRTEARLVRRVCSRFENDERASCLHDALNGEGLTIRLRLRDWIRQL